MITFSLVEATVKLRSPFFHCSWDGLMINSPSTIPTCVVAHGPQNGISEILVAIALPSIATNSGRHSGSTLITILFKVTSFL